MNIILVTPAGREGYLKVLYKYLLTQKDDFSEWHLWLNTVNKQDIEFCKKLEKNNSWIKTFDLDERCDNNSSICSFFKHAVEEDTVYIRFDDDVIFLENNFIKKFAEERLKNKTPFFIFPMIINNGNMGYHLQENDRVWFPVKLTYAENCLNELWKEPTFGEKIHRDFLLDVKNDYIERYHINDIVIDNYYRHSINCISWLGETMKVIVENNDIKTYRDEEMFISVTYPKANNNPNVIIGDLVCCHFAFGSQRVHLDSTDILLEYDKISNKIYNEYILEKAKSDILKESKNSISEKNLIEILNNFKKNIMLFD
jgi:hypothetical protein